MRRLLGRSSGAGDTTEKTPKPPKPTASDKLDEASGNINRRVDHVDTKLTKLDKELAQYRAQIKKTRPGPAQEALKRRALGVLKQKKMYEKQRDNMASQAFNVDQATFAIGTMKDTVQTVQSMKDANKELKKTYKKVNIDKVEATMDDLSDMLEINDEIQDVLGRSYDGIDEVDEEDLDAELDALGELDLEEETTSEKPSYLQDDALAAPVAPTDAPQLPSREDAELRGLQADMQ